MRALRSAWREKGILYIKYLLSRIRGAAQSCVLGCASIHVGWGALSVLQCGCVTCVHMLGVCMCVSHVCVCWVCVVCCMGMFCVGVCVCVELHVCVYWRVCVCHGSTYG